MPSAKQPFNRDTTRSLADSIDFNQRQCAQEMPYEGQVLFEIAESSGGESNDPGHLAAWAQCLLPARDEGLKAALQNLRLDTMAIPSAGECSSHAAVAGYPNLAMPVGFDACDRPVDPCRISAPRTEARLLSQAFDLAQRFQGSPYAWPEAGLCAANSRVSRVSRSSAPQALRRSRCAALRRF